MNKHTLTDILNEALMDEYKARDTYGKIIDTFGPIRPSIHIVATMKYRIPPSSVLLERTVFSSDN